MQPAGKYLGERFHRAGGVPAVLTELLRVGKIDGNALTVTGRSARGEHRRAARSMDADVITTYEKPVQEKAGFLVLKGNLFDFAIMKTSVISPEFRKRYLGNGDSFECRAVVFDGSTDYHDRINDPALGIDENTILVIRGSGPLGWPGSAEVVNMQPPDALLKRGIMSLPTLGDGRQSGTSDSPRFSIVRRKAPRVADSPGCAPVTGSASTWPPAPVTCWSATRKSRAARRKACRRCRKARRPGRSCIARPSDSSTAAPSWKWRSNIAAWRRRRRATIISRNEVLMSPPRLTEASLHAARSGTILPTYDRDATRFGIVHIGPGAFHRAHQAYYVDTLLHSDKRWAISALSLKSTGLRDALKDQQGLYTLVELGAAPRARVIGAIRELLVGATDAEAAFARLTARDTRLVSLTVTEKGYCLDAKNLLDLAECRHRARPRESRRQPAQHHRLDRRRPAAPARGRRAAVHGAELRQPAGQRLGAAPRAGGIRRGSAMPTSRAGSRAEVVCPRTMVDSITPATDDALRKRALGAHRPASTNGPSSASRSRSG